MSVGRRPGGAVGAIRHRRLSNRPARREEAPLVRPPAASVAKGARAVIFGQPETLRFLAAVERLKQQTRKQQQQTRQARRRLRAALRKLREC
jgi:hypothetical protein